MLKRLVFLLLRGIADPRTSYAKDLQLISRLGTDDKTLVVLPRATHMAHVEDSQAAWVDAVVSFAERPRANRRRH